MTTYNVNVTNGVATVQIDTGNLEMGTYSVNTIYHQNATYKEGTSQSSLYINNQDNHIHAISNLDFIYEDGTILLSLECDNTSIDDFDTYPSENDTNYLDTNYKGYLCIKTDSNVGYVLNIGESNMMAYQESPSLENFGYWSQSNLVYLTNIYSTDGMMLNYSINDGFLAMEIAGIIDYATQVEIYIILVNSNDELLEAKSSGFDDLY